MSSSGNQGMTREGALRLEYFIIGLGIFALILIFIAAQLKIIPEIEKILADMKQTPDGLSGFLFKLSHFTKKVWVLVVGGIIAGAGCGSGLHTGQYGHSAGGRCGSRDASTLSGR